MATPDPPPPPLPPKFIGGLRSFCCFTATGFAAFLPVCAEPVPLGVSRSTARSSFEVEDADVAAGAFTDGMLFGAVSALEGFGLNCFGCVCATPLTLMPTTTAITANQNLISLT